MIVTIFAAHVGLLGRLKQRERRTVRLSFAHVRDAVGHRALKGATFALMNTALRLGLSLVSTAALARLLAPRDFGLIAMTSVFAEFIALLGNFGLFNILVQKPRLYRTQLDTAFWLALMIGSILGLLAFSFASAAAWFFGEPEITPLIRVLSIAAVMLQLEAVHSAVLNRTMRFDLVVLCQLISVVVRTCTTIAFAYAGYGVWSFVAGTLIGQFVSLSMFYFAAPLFPRFRFRPLSLKSYVKPALSYFGSGILFYINSYLDSSVVARRLGAVEVAYYQNGRQLADELRVRLLPALQSVLFPAFSALQDDAKRLQAACVRASEMFTLLYYPLGIGLAAVAPDAVLLLFGEKWLPMVPILQVLATSTAIRGGLAGVLPVFRAKNLATQEFRNYVWLTILFVISAVVGSYWGALGVAFGLLFCTAFGGLPIAWMAFRIINLGMHDLIKAIAPQAISAVLMFVAVQFLMHFLVNWNVPLVWRLLSEIPVGAATFALSMFVFGRRILMDAIDIAKEMVFKQRTAGA